MLTSLIGSLMAVKAEYYFVKTSLIGSFMTIKTILFCVLLNLEKNVLSNFNPGYRVKNIKEKYIGKSFICAAIV